MKEGDLVEAVDGEAVGSLTLAEYIDKLRGEEGTPVSVAVRRAGEKQPLTFRMTRQAMRHATISGPEGRQGFPSRGTEAAPGTARPGSFRLAGAVPVGYIKIESILASTPREVREAAATMEAEGLKALVIDLRQPAHGPGSEGLHPAVLLADELLDSGTIGRVRLASREVTYRAEPGSLFPGWPIAVLVDRATSDHAEWIAAALKENKRATIVGSPTAGLGISRSIVPLGEGGRTASLATGLLEWPDGRPLGYFLPAGRFFTETGEWMANTPSQHMRLGVTPDVAVSSARRAGAEDGALKAALDVLSKAIQKPDAAGPGDESKVPATDGRPSR